jgi:hypothetical protein
MHLRFFCQIRLDEELRDLLLLCSEGAEVGDALELLGGEGRLGWQWRLAGEVSGGAGVEREEAAFGELLDGGPGGLVENLEFGGIFAPVGFMEEGGDGGGSGRVAENCEDERGSFRRAAWLPDSG